MSERQTSGATIKRRFRQFFEFAAGTTTLIASLIGVLLMMLVVFPALPLHGEMIDVKLHYTPADIQAETLQYGPQGRAIYAIASPTLDSLFPVLYVTFFAGLIYRFRPNERLWVMALIPVFAGVWDLCENAQITAMLLQYPGISAIGSIVDLSAAVTSSGTAKVCSSMP